MMSGEVLSGVNKTNFLVSLHTVPPLPACVVWDDATTMQQPMGKTLGQVKLGAGCSMMWAMQGTLDHCGGGIMAYFAR